MFRGLIENVHKDVKILGIEAALEGATLLGDAERYVMPYLKRSAVAVGNHIKMFDLSPERGICTSITNKAMISIMRGKGLMEADLLALLSLLQHSPHLVIDGLVAPALGIRSQTDPRIVVVTCPTPDDIVIEAYPTGSFNKYTWDVEADTRLHFAAIPA
jgi:hypothetical protein